MSDRAGAALDGVQRTARGRGVERLWSVPGDREMGEKERKDEQKLGRRRMAGLGALAVLLRARRDWVVAFGALRQHWHEGLSMYLVRRQTKAPPEGSQREARVGEGELEKPKNALREGQESVCLLQERRWMGCTGRCWLVVERRARFEANAPGQLSLARELQVLRGLAVAVQVTGTSVSG